MDKKKVIDTFIAHFQKAIESARNALAGTRQIINDSPTANQSHSDTTRSQLGGVALAQETRLKEMEAVSSGLMGMSTSSMNKVSVGALFVISDDGNRRQWYFMFVGAQGDEVEIDGVTIVGISIRSPIGSASIGKGPGENFIVNKRRFSITVVE